MYIKHTSLSEMFGQNGFTPLNKKLKIFDVTHWLKGKYTRGYKPTNKVQKIKTDYLNSDNKEPSRIIRSDGKYMKTPPRAIASLGINTRIVNKWDNPDFNTWVAVNIKELENIKERLQGFLNSFDSSLSQAIKKGNVYRCINEINKILKLANTDIKQGHVIHHYHQCTNGRIFAAGTNIQTTTKLVKMAALYGLWEYDFINCHFAIFKQLANNINIECPVIDSYLYVTGATRVQIAAEIGISIDDTKKCLIALIYGANSFEWQDAAIPKLIGRDKARELSRHPKYSTIRQEVEMARTEIIKQWPAPRNKYMNAMDITIQKERRNKKGRMTKTPAKKILAHLIQGIEAKMLNTIYHEYPKRLVLLQHDGFASTSRLNKDAIQQLVKDKTGFDIRVKEWHIGTKEGITNEITKFISILSL